MLRTLTLFLALLFITPVTSADFFPDGVRGGYGKYFNLAVKRTAEIQQYRLGLIWNIHDQLWSSDSIRLESYAELGVGYWKSTLNPAYDARRIGDRAIRQISLTPMFRLKSQTPLAGYVYPFLDAGVGPSWQDTDDIEQQHLSGINTGGKWQFEIRLLMGIEFGSEQQFELSYGWMHYSNANINDINEGLDFQTIQLGYQW